MITWTAQCPRCAAKQRVPGEYRHIDDAKKWAAAWQRQHFLEVHDANPVKEGSEEDS